MDTISIAQCQVTHIEWREGQYDRGTEKEREGG